MSCSDLWHYTCSHSVDGVTSDGMVLPGWAVDERLRVVSAARFAWFTDLDVPLREALGLTGNFTSCDRTVHRFRVTDPSRVRRWVNVRRHHPDLWALEDARGAMPAHWWVSDGPVPVVADEAVSTQTKTLADLVAMRRERDEWRAAATAAFDRQRDES